MAIRKHSADIQIRILYGFGSEKYPGQTSNRKSQNDIKDDSHRSKIERQPETFHVVSVLIQNHQRNEIQSVD